MLLKQSEQQFYDAYIEDAQRNIDIAEAKEIRNFSRYLNREYVKGVNDYLATGKVSGWESYFKPSDFGVMYSILYMNVGVRASKVFIKHYGKRFTPIIKPENYSILWRDYFRDTGKRIAEIKGAGVAKTQQKELTRVIQRFHRNPEFQILNERQAGRILRSQVKNLSEQRAKAIVRTEAAAAANEADEKTAIDMFGKENLKKYWWTSNDERVRDAHAIAGATYTLSKAIDLNQTFLVGGETMLKPRLGSIAANNVNCRCSSISVVKNQ